MTTRGEANERFVQAIEKVISDHWGELAPWACEDDEDDEASAEDYPNPYPAAWAISIGIASLDRPKAGSFVTSWAPDGQLFFTTSGLLTAAASHWEI